MQNEFGSDVLIQGYFFQWQQRAGLRTVPIHGVTAVAVNQFVAVMFAGGLSLGPDGAWTGWLNELNEGPSVLYEIDLVPDALRFNKRYEKGHDGAVIEYTFKLMNGYWVGTWSGSDDRGHYGNGEAVCILTPVPADFFMPPSRTYSDNPRQDPI